MSETCAGSCETCGSSCSSKSSQPESFLAPCHELSNIRRVIGVVSGKGGVGKSLVTSLLACEAARRGFTAGILDADVTGPSIPKAFGISEPADHSDLGMYPVTTESGIQIMSINLLLYNETDPVVWRGPVIGNVVKQFWTDVIWNDIDFLFVDMPPGTGDVPLTVFQTLPVDGILVVTSPQDLVRVVVEKAVRMAELMNIPVIGLVENFSHLKCPDCGKEIALFGQSHVGEIAERHGIPLLTRIPLDPAVAAAVDAGKIESVVVSEINPVVDAVIDQKDRTE